MLFNLYFSKKAKNQKPKNLQFEKTKKPMKKPKNKKPKNLTMPTMPIVYIEFIGYMAYIISY